MGFKYKDTCYDQQADALQAVVDDCGVKITPISSTSASASWCKASGLNIQFYYVDKGGASPNAFTYALPVTFPSCTYTPPSSTAKFSNQDVIDMSWLVVSVWVVAWGIRKMIEVIRR